jgi:hypothetical protein
MQPLTSDELSAHANAVADSAVLSSDTVCAITGFRDGDVLYVSGVLSGAERLEMRRVVAVVDAKSGNRLDVWTDDSHVMSSKEIEEGCVPNLDPVNVSPTRAGVMLHQPDGDALFLFHDGKLDNMISVTTKGKDKQVFRVRKGIANGMFDVELKAGKQVDVLRWTDAGYYDKIGASNPYVVSARASSELVHQGDFTYSALEAIDGAPETTWAEATKGSGAGETLELTLDDAYRVDKLKVIAGCGFTQDLWLKNERIKKLKIVFDDKSEQVADLEDNHKAGAWTTIPITHDKPTATLKLEILDVYPGSAWKDGCISEVVVEPKLLPATGELSKATAFLGASCKTGWDQLVAQWKLTGKPTDFNPMSEVNKRVGKPDLTNLFLKEGKRVSVLRIDRCEDAPALVGSLAKDDLALRLCTMKLEDVRRTFGDPPKKDRARTLRYPWGGGEVVISTKDRVTSVYLRCPTP